METRVRFFVMVLFLVMACGRHAMRAPMSSADAGDEPVANPDVSEAKDGPVASPVNRSTEFRHVLSCSFPPAWHVDSAMRSRHCSG
jgi:hypothetical protein